MARIPSLVLLYHTKKKSQVDDGLPEIPRYVSRGEITDDLRDGGEKEVRENTPPPPASYMRHELLTIPPHATPIPHPLSSSPLLWKLAILLIEGDQQLKGQKIIRPLQGFLRKFIVA